MSKKNLLLPLLAEYVLANGLSAATLRPMAKAAGTSDRMLIYHFGNKDAVIEETLDFIVAQMTAMFNQIFEGRSFATEDALVKAVTDVMRAPMAQPFVHIWLDIVSAASRGDDAYRRIGKNIIDIYLEWLAAYHPDGAAGAPSALIRIDGAMILDAVGRSDVPDSALLPS